VIAEAVELTFIQAESYLHGVDGPDFRSNNINVTLPIVVIIITMHDIDRDMIAYLEVAVEVQNFMYFILVLL